MTEGIGETMTVVAEMKNTGEEMMIVAERTMVAVAEMKIAESKGGT